MRKKDKCLQDIKYKRPWKSDEKIQLATVSVEAKKERGEQRQQYHGEQCDHMYTRECIKSKWLKNRLLEKWSGIFRQNPSL